MLSILEMIKRDVPGFAIGGLSGGEKKDDFWKMVTLCTNMLPKEKPRYLMGVGYVQHLDQLFLKHLPTLPRPLPSEKLNVPCAPKLIRWQDCLSFLNYLFGTRESYDPTYSQD